MPDDRDPSPNPAPTLLVGRYRLGELLGRGAHGEVHLAEDYGRGGELVALKQVKGQADAGEWQEEAARGLRWFRHPNWADVLDAGFIKEGAWYQSLRYVRGKSLKEIGDPVAPDLVWRFIEDGARVLQALHRRGLIHYDVTPGNFILEDAEEGPRFVLTDGGLAHMGPVTGARRGSPLYLAPELMEDQSHDARVDLYALGLVAFRLATGQEPFGAEEGAALAQRKRQSAPHARSLNPQVPEELDDLIAKLLNRHPDRRPASGSAILRLIEKGTGKSIPEMRKAEAYAAADGGCLVGRTSALKRFERSRLQLSSALAVLRTKASGFPISGIEEPVLLLCGNAGSGCTRLSRQMVHEAQSAEIPVLLIAGRDGSPNPQAPLDHLFEGLRALGRERGPTLEPGLRPHRTRHTRRERAYSKQRTVEQFMRLAHAAARRTPFLLAVEDYGELPELAQAAVRALARDLLSRAEHGPDRAAPPVLLLIDLGDTDLQPFLIPDSETPRRPVLPVPPLTPAQVTELCSQSFPGLAAMPQDDCARVHKIAEGLPRALVALLGEAAYRGDLGPTEQGWKWDLADLDSYPVNARLPIHLADAIRRADEPLRALLSYLALAEAPLGEEVVQELWGRLTDTPIPSTPLVNTRRDKDRTLYALSNGALRRTALESLDANVVVKAARMRELLDALQRHPHVDSVLDRVRLLLETADPRAAIALLSDTWNAFGAEPRFSAQVHIRRALNLDPSLAAESDTRSAISKLLERGPHAVDVATQLAHAFPEREENIRAILRVAEVLEDAEDLEAALRLLDSRQPTPSAEPEDRILFHVRRSKLAMDQQKREDGRSAFLEARRHYGQLRRQSSVPAAVTAEYLAARARFRLADPTSVRRAEHLLRQAEKAASSARDRLLRAQINNNLGIAMARSGALDRARMHFRRSLRLKKTLGDLKGEASTMVNLARVNLRSGQVLSATKNCIDCVHRAQRYGLFDTQIRALRLLADAYDRQHRPTLALDTLLRAWRMVRLNPASDIARRVAWDLAPLAAVVGRMDVVSMTQRATAAIALAAGRHEQARGNHYLSSAIASLHCGNLGRFKLQLRRAGRYAAKLRAENRWMLGVLRSLVQLDADRLPEVLTKGARHNPTVPMRYLYRVHVWYRRALRGGHIPPVPGLTGVRGGGARGIPAGALGRIAAEFLLSAASRDSSLLDDEALAQVQTYAGLSDAGLLQARALAVRSTHLVSPGEWKQAQHFSQAIALMDKIASGTQQPNFPLPDEIGRAAGQLAEGLHIELDAGAELRDLHALAHQALVRPGRTGRRTSHSGILPHERLAVALRHVLEASARMRGANGVRQLIASITKHTIDITGAQRACVVLRETDSDIEIWESSSVWDADGPVALRDVSNTVIQLVLETQTPVFRPYVIEDESLLESSESIKNLGLLSVLCVPLRRRGALYGVLYADSTAVGAFEPVDVEVLSLFADQAAAAIETSRLVEDVQRSFAELKAMQDRLVRGERLRVIGELSSGVAHEFNNLLTAILARIQMMGLNYLPPEARRDLELIEKAALDAAAVVRRLQSFSRSQRQADFTMVDVGEVCRDAVDLLRPLWRKRGRDGSGPINVHLRTEPGLVVRGDPTELREVVTNVLKNAIDSLRDGGRVTVSARRQRGRIHLRIRDDGSGIPAEILAKVFDPFYTTKGERGTGLGLSLSQQIIEQHGGSITIDSKEGSGTTVSVQLPASEAGAARAAPVPEEEEAPRDSLRVVVVDDDRDVLKSLCTYLERSGYEVISASNGSEGLEKTMEHEPDVVLTDVSMPGMDGIELCRRLHEAKPHLPIVLMSGWASDLNHASAREAGAREVLSKPFEMPEVTRLLATVADPEKK